MTKTTKAIISIRYSKNIDNMNKNELFKAAKILAEEIARIYNVLETHNLISEDEDCGGHA